MVLKCAREGWFSGPPKKACFSPNVLYLVKFALFCVFDPFFGGVFVKVAGVKMCDFGDFWSKLCFK